MTSTRRVAVVNDTSSYVGPALATELATRGHDLVIGDPADGLVDELEALGAAVEVVTGVSRLRSQADADALLEAAMTRFGRIDSAAMFSGQIVTGSFFDSTEQQLERVVSGCIEAPYRFLKTFGRAMRDQRHGQILVLTSAAGARPTPNAPLYSAARASATMLARNVAGEVAASGVQVNVVGTNYIDFPGLLQASGATTPEGRARIEAQVPMRRLGGLEEFANFCMVFLDGTSGFTTGQFVAYAGGWV